MTARYRMERNPDSGKNGNKMPLHPRLIPYETVSIKKLMKYAKSRSTYSEADIAGALQLITDLVTERLREGDNVEIEGLGFFSVSLQSRAVMSKTELRSESVRFKNVNFRCCQQLKKALKTMPLTRMKSSGHHAPGMADREELLYRYLDENSYITVRSYRYLIGLSDYIGRFRPSGEGRQPFVCHLYPSERGRHGHPATFGGRFELAWMKAGYRG